MGIRSANSMAVQRVALPKPSLKWLSMVVLSAIMLWTPFAHQHALGQDNFTDPNQPEEPAPGSQLSERQSSVAQRYQKLEELLLRLADVEAAENPERAALLKQAVKQSRDKFILQQLQEASSALKGQKFSDAIERQDAGRKGLAEILTLLTSEDRASRIRDEKKRVAEMIKDLKRLERSQRSTRARTENGADL